MDCSLREHSHLVLVESVVQVSGAVLSCHGSEETALDDEVEFSCARMDVRSVEATGAEESDGYRSTLADEGRESGVVSADNLSALTLGDTSDAVGVLKVEDEIGIFEESLAIDSVRGKDELLEEGQAACRGCSRGRSDAGLGASN